VPAIDVRHLGEFIREQRETAKISLRELAKTAGVSNPYLSQIERGLRKPSAEILQQIAKGLRISAEVLYVRAGILEQREASPVVDAILADVGLTERQKQVLLEVHDSFRRENVATEASSTPAPSSAVPAPAPAPVTRPTTSPTKKSTPTVSTRAASS
jgi:transcriptional regulator with XRE-family HTH domain